MGRNYDNKNLVPIGGEVYRNASEGTIVDSTGAVYISSASYSNIIKISDYPKFCNQILDPFTHSSLLPTKGPIGNYINGKLVTSGSVAVPQFSVGSVNGTSTPVGPHSTATFVRGASATNGANLAVAIGTAPQNNTYYYSSEMSSDAVGMNISTNTVLNIFGTTQAIHVWYDTTTSKFRLLFASAMWTSTDATSWTKEGSASILAYNKYNFANGCNYSAVRAKDQTVIAIGDETQNNSGYKIFVSTNGGVTFTDQTNPFCGAANFNGTNGSLVNYDGTTIFLGGYASGVAKYSTNSGATWTTSTVSAGQSWVNPHTNQATCKGSTDSIFMVTSASQSLYTTNGGQSFTYSAISGGPAINSGSGALVHNGTSTWVWPTRNSNGFVSAYASVNNGTTWTYYTFPVATSSYQMYYFDAFYFVDYGTGLIYKSTNGTSWTKIYSSVETGLSLGTPNYGNPVLQTANFILFNNLSYNKTTGVFAFVNSQYITNISQGYGNVFSAQLTSSNAFQVGENNSYQKFVSDDVGGGTVTYITTQALTSQQGGSGSNTPRQIAYWRIK